ncbi:hypothetical protein ABZU75_05720 [Streptosporangium sp. NPDC005286]|uniref:hypothetical protein n=1 Tax=Streptosporangium sp. NPDC005286 TaxID=3154463 RepID=UPI0033B42B46
MGKFEGMDPKLVRDLLSEVRRAADQMRNVEGKVTQLMSGAGLSSQSTHRPVQIADACDVMVRDVSARVALLEKRINQNATAPPAEPKTGDTKPDSGAAGDDAKPETPKADGLKPAVGADDKPRVGDQSAGSTQRDDPKDSPKPEPPKGDETKPETGSKGDEGKPEAGSKGDETSPRDGSKETPKPEASGADDRKPDTGSKGDETSPREGDSPKENVKPVDTAPRETPKPDATPTPEAPRAEDPPREAPKPDPVPEAPRAEDTPREAPKPDPMPEAPRAEDSRPETPRVEDLKPAVPGPGEGPQDGGRPVDDVPRQTPEAPGPDATPVPEMPRADDTQPEIVNVNDTMPGGEDSDAKGDSGSKGDETTPRGDGSVGGAPVNDPDAKGDSGSKGDERSPRQEGGTSGNDILDSYRKDHPDDIDQSGDQRAKVVEVDGVKVLQIPLDSPTAAEVDELLKNIEDIPPLEMPTVDNVSATAGQPGWVEPHGPLDSAKPDYPLLDTAGPTTDQTVQPPGTGGDATPEPAGTTSGEAAVQPQATTSAVPAVQTAGTASGEAASQPAVVPRGDAGTPSIGDAVFSEARGAEDAAGGSGQSAGTAPGGVAAAPDGSVARWAGDGDDVVTAEASPLDLDALRTLADNAREIEPLEMPGVRVPEGETWGEGAWAPMDIGPDGPAGDVEPGNPLRPIPPPGGGQ